MLVHILMYIAAIKDWLDRIQWPRTSGAWCTHFFPSFFLILVFSLFFIPNFFSLTELILLYGSREADVVPRPRNYQVYIRPGVMQYRWRFNLYRAAVFFSFLLFRFTLPGTEKLGASGYDDK